LPAGPVLLPAGPVPLAAGPVPLASIGPVPLASKSCSTGCWSCSIAC
jgi:hypothetical protein